ncbi:MAG TPA: phosphoribosylformylglycinamidine synthase subunit PurQ, partial [Candidatus Polarisedimenticolaceae bacterium]|nr:phosphoribosylformylglycinamidine synthase subunit PurQ [Candidatus Polarisedimenticolaceae bacterium]
MRWGVIVFPGSCDDQDVFDSLKREMAQKVKFLWHKDELAGHFDCLVLPGGFSYGDYLRCGAMARFSPIMRGVEKFAQEGGLVLGICNGFQILCEARLLPGALVRNAGLKFVCQQTWLRVEETDTSFTSQLKKGQLLKIPVKHGEGRYHADEVTLERLHRHRQVLLRYVNAKGKTSPAANPN